MTYTKKNILLVILVFLSFFKNINANEISEFEIEYISVGSKLFDIFSENEFNNAKATSKLFKQKDNKFHSLLFYKLNRFTTYDGVRVSWNPNDLNKQLIGVSGIKYFRNKIDECLEFRENIINNIDELLGNDAIKKNYGKNVHTYDKSGNSYYYEVSFNFIKGGMIRVHCTDWSEEFKNYWDALEVVIQTEKFTEILSQNPY